MKKILQIFALSVALTLIVPTVSAQLFDEGDVVVNAGIGVGASYYNYGPSSLALPLLFVSGDYCLREDLGPGNLGIGAIMGFTSHRIDYFTYDYHENTFIIAARGTYHFTDLVDKLDLYGGISLGGYISTVKYSDPYFDDVDISANNGILPELFAGVRYFFSDNVAVMSELGPGISWLKLGISFKF